MATRLCWRRLCKRKQRVGRGKRWSTGNAAAPQTPLLCFIVLRPCSCNRWARLLWVYSAGFILRSRAGSEISFAHFRA
jgi:hypothetical protein